MKKIIIIILLFAFNYANSQNTIGEWEVHLPYYNGKLVTKNKDIVYCVTEDGLFTLNETDNSLAPLSKVNGLSDVNISAINANEELDVVIIAYENSNIDLIKGNEIINISDIKDKQIIGNKRVNSILFVQDYAYLSCGFGIIKLNIEKNEISDTYYIGENGLQINVTELSYDGTFLYAATQEGIYKSEEAKPEIVNYQSWEKCTILPISDKEFTHISVYNNKLFTLGNYSPDSSILYQVSLDFNSYELAAENIYKKKKIKTINNELILFVDTGMYFYNSINGVFEYSERVYSWPRPKDVFLYDDVMYIASYNRGLLKKKGNNERAAYQPNGPIYTETFDIDIVNSKLWATRGGRVGNTGGNGLAARAYIYENNKWTYLKNNKQRDWTVVKINKKDPKQVFIGNTNYGLVEIYDEEIIKQYDTSNYNEHTLQTIIPSKNYIRIGGLAFDDDQNLWMTNFGVDEQISVRKKDGTWKSFNYKDVFDVIALDMIITQNDTKWVILRRTGLAAFHNNGTIDDETDDQVRQFKNVDKDGTILPNYIYAIAEDNEGVIWLGTNEGIVVYYNPENVFDNQEYFYASQIVIDVNGEGKHLLKTELIQTIDIDGANRKWIGTEKSGVFLLSPDGTREIEHFTEENSPLLSNDIKKIKIDDDTGIVYIATSRGIISYKSDATEAGEFFADVYAYPNPVRPEYEGDIVIKGLIEDTNVKITDIAGNFVYETTSMGGQALWDGKTLSGERVKTGVYLIFLSNDDGTKTAITKLLFIN